MGRKQEQAIIALLKAPTITEAAKIVGVSESTLGRWMQDEEFQERYQASKKEALSQAVGQLQSAAGEAVRVLREVAVSNESPANSRVAAAKSIIELAAKFRDSEDLERRIEELEAQLED